MATGAAVAALIASPASVEAASIKYDISGVDVNAYGGTTLLGLVIETQALELPEPFYLDDGESFTFDLFRIYTDEVIVTAPDFIPHPISVEMAFASPAGAGTADPLTGWTGGFISVSGNIFTGLIAESFGWVAWNGPVLVDLPGLAFTIELTGTRFNEGGVLLDSGPQDGGVVQATIRQLHSVDPVPVPEPVAALMGLTGMGLLALRRSRVA